VALTHGATIDHRTFEPQVAVLAQRYRVLTWDVRGHGLSQPLTSDFTLRQAADDLLAILDHQGYRKVTLVGQSMGGNIAQELLFLHPERVTALVILDSACNTLKLSKLEQWIMRMSPMLFRLYPYSLLKWQSIHSSSISPSIRKYLSKVVRAHSKASFVAILAATGSGLHYEPDYRITCPLLLARGEHDHLGNFKTAMPRWAKRDPQSRYVVVPNAGHASNQDNPEFVNKLLLEFLAEVYTVHNDGSESTVT
jgi:pimeloyl-ACP methyl ester carboxylesterase